MWKDLRSTSPPAPEEVRHDRMKQHGLTNSYIADRIGDTFARLVPALEATDTVVTLAPLAPADPNVLNTAAETCRLIDRISSPYVRLLLDVKAMSSEAEPIPAIIAASGRQLAHFHANDANLQGSGRGATRQGKHRLHEVCRRRVASRPVRRVSTFIIRCSPTTTLSTRLTSTSSHIPLVLTGFF